MIPTEFDYVRAGTLDEAISLLAQNEDAKILAGGHSLIPAMKLRLATPPMLIDIGRIKDLSYIREEKGQIRIGAMTTHYQIESSDLLKKICPLLPECASHIGDVQVRNKGTIGGSVAHSDPAGDWPAAVIALNAEVGQAYVKMHHPASGFAVVGVAASLTLDRSGGCSNASIAITGVSSKAYRAAAVEAALTGKKLDDQTIAAAVSHASDGVDLNGDLFASADYRRHLAEVYTRRAITAATKSVPCA